MIEKKKPTQNQNHKGPALKRLYYSHVLGSGLELT